MQENSYWTNLPQAEIAERLKEMGTPVSQPTAGALLDDLGFTKRQSWPMNGVSTFASLTTPEMELHRHRRGWHLIAEMK